MPLIPVSADSTSQAPAEKAFSLNSFSNNVASGSQLSSVAFDDLSYSVVQQPSGSPAYVSSSAGVVTQFGLASSYGSIGLIAHNSLAGAKFSLLQVGDTITLVYGDGSAQSYSVTEIKKYQALSPTNPYSNFTPVGDSSSVLSATDLFMDVYASSGHLVLQTCIAKDGVDSWGRLFVIADPA